MNRSMYSHDGSQGKGGGGTTESWRMADDPEIIRTRRLLYTRLELYHRSTTIDVNYMEHNALKPGVNHIPLPPHMALRPNAGHGLLIL